MGPDQFVEDLAGHRVDDAGHALLDRQLVEFCCEALRGAAGVAEDDRGAVGEDPLQDLGVDAGPDRRAPFGQGGRRRTGREFHLDLAERRHVLDRDDDLDLELLADAGVDDLHAAPASRFGPTAQEFGHLLQWSLRRRESDALRRCVGDLLQPLQGQHQVGATFGGRHRVDLVDDHRLDAGERLARGRRQHQVQRLGCGDQQVGRASDQLLAVVRSGVAGPHADLRSYETLSQPLGGEFDPLERSAQVLLDVEGQRPQRRDVEHPRAVRPLLGAGRGREPVDRREECGERLAGTRRGTDQCVLAGGDVRPALYLRCGRLGKRRREPLADGRRERLEHRVRSDRVTLPSGPVSRCGGTTDG